MGHPFITGGRRFLDLGIMKAEMSFATTVVATRRRTVLRNLLPSTTSMVDVFVCVNVYDMTQLYLLLTTPMTVFVEPHTTQHSTAQI